MDEKAYEGWTHDRVVKEISYLQAKVVELRTWVEELQGELALQRPILEAYRMADALGVPLRGSELRPSEDAERFWLRGETIGGPSKA